MNKVQLARLGVPPRVAQALVYDNIQSAVAAAGTAIGTATPLTGDVCLVYSVHAGVNDGVQLRAGTLARQQVVINRSAAGANGASALKVYPPTGGRINEGTVNASVTVPAVSAGAEVYFSVNALDYYRHNG